MTIAMSLIYLCSFKLYCSTSPSSPPGFQCELLSQFCAKQLVVINTGKLSLPVISKTSFLHVIAAWQTIWYNFQWP